MELNFATEEPLRALNHPLLTGVLDLWHREAESLLGRDIPVLVGNRRKHPTMSAYRGMNTQVTLSILDRKLYLALWCDPYELLYGEMLKEMGYGEPLVRALGPLLESGADLGENYEPSRNLARLDWDSLSRRMIFWVLRIRGFRKMGNRDRRFGELESLLAAEAWTPPLNRVLEDLDIQAADTLPGLVEDTLAGMMAMKEEPPRRVDRAVNALRLWNLLAVCPAEQAGRIDALLAESFPRIREAVGTIGSLAEGLDLNRPEDNLKFMEGFIKTYRLPGEWEPVNEVEAILKQL